jgi:hypothetical protein
MATPEISINSEILRNIPRSFNRVTPLWVAVLLYILDGLIATVMTPQSPVVCIAILTMPLLRLAMGSSIHFGASGRLMIVVALNDDLAKCLLLAALAANALWLLTRLLNRYLPQISVERRGQLLTFASLLVLNIAATISIYRLRWIADPHASVVQTVPLLLAMQVYFEEHYEWSSGILAMFSTSITVFVAVSMISISEMLQ